MLYTIYTYDGIPTRERRPVEYAGEGVEVEELNFNSDADAVIYAAEKVAEMNGADTVLDDMSSDIGLEYLDSLDWGDGSAICIAIKRDAVYVYGDEAALDTFYIGSLEADDYLELEGEYEDPDYKGSPDPEDWKDDDAITEAIINNPKITDFSKVKVDIASLEKEISKIKYETSSIGSWGFSDKVLAFLSEEEIKAYNNLKDQINQMEDEIRSLENQYQSVEIRWFRTGDDEDFEEKVTILDDKLKKELEPKVKQIRNDLAGIRKQLYAYERKAKDAYNMDAADRRAKSGLEDKIASLSRLKASKDELLKEIASSPDFEEVLEFIKSEFSEVKVINAGISDEGVFMDVEVREELELEDEHFDDEEYLMEDSLADDFEDDIGDALGIDYNFECEDSDSQFKFELLDVYIEGDARVSRSFTPGRMYMPNGDPGYPDEYDAEISGGATGVAEVRVRKVK